MAMQAAVEASAPLSDRQKFELEKAKAEANIRNKSPILSGKSLLESKREDEALKKLASEGRVPQEVLNPAGPTSLVEKPETELPGFASLEEAQRAPADLPTNQVQAPSIDSDGKATSLTNEIDQSVKQFDAYAAKARQEMAALDKETQNEIDLQEMAKQEAERKKQLQREYDAINPELKNYFAGKTTFQKIVAGIGLGLASLTPQGAQNALKIIDQEIERDLDIQKLAKQNKKDEITASENLYSKYMNHYKDARMARMATKADMYQRTAMELQVMGQKVNSTAAKQKLAMGAEELQLKAQQQKITLNELATKRMKEEMSGKVPGYEGQLQNASEVKDFKDTVMRTREVMNGLAKLKEIGKRAGKSFSLKDRAEAESIRRTLIGALRVPITGPGAMNESELALLERLIPDVTSFFTLDSVNEKSIDTLMGEVKDREAIAAKTYGLRRISEGELKNAR